MLTNLSTFQKLWHLSAGQLIAFLAAAIGLHDYSTWLPYLSFWEAVWNTLSVVLPQWILIIIPVGLLFSFLSLAVYASLQTMKEETWNWTYLLVVIVIAMPLISLFQAFSLWILLPILVECLILRAIDARK